MSIPGRFRYDKGRAMNGISSFLFFADAGSRLGWWPLGILGICVALIVVLITVLRVHAFLALVLVAITAGLLSPPGILPGERAQPIHVSQVPMVLQQTGSGSIQIQPLPPGAQPSSGTLITNVTLYRPAQPILSRGVHVVNLTIQTLGRTAGQIAVVIALASIIGMGLMESGAADQVVRRFLRVFGERRAGGVLAFTSYFLSIPIFFDTFFMLLLPLARALSLRTRQNYLLFVMAIGIGASVTHSLLIPHPGPLAMADMLGVDVGLSILVGIVVGVIPIFLTWQVAKWIGRRLLVPVRDVPGSSIEELQGLLDRPDTALPSFGASIAPVLIPLVLISLASGVKVFGHFGDSAEGSPPMWFQILLFLGDRNIALLIGALLALRLVWQQRKPGLEGLQRLIGPPLETAGMIILITSAGGAFGTMLRYAGVGEVVKAAAGSASVNLIVLAWLVAAVIRIAQGSATVAMMTAVAMVAPLVGPDLPYHPIYLFMAIGFGAMILSWMNDSGFWVVCKLSGLTEKETLKSWTIVSTCNSIFGLLVCLGLSKLIPGV